MLMRYYRGTAFDINFLMAVDRATSVWWLRRASFTALSMTRRPFSFALTGYVMLGPGSVGLPTP